MALKRKIKALLYEVLFIAFVLAAGVFLEKTNRVVEAASIPFAQLEAPARRVSVPLEGEKICYLTFDDGPSSNTEAVLDILKELDGSYDFIFMDAAKGQYIHFLPDVIRLLAVNGVLISDNVLQNGEVLDSKYVVERRNRTIHARMREYLHTLKNHEELETSILPLGDGVSLSVKVRCSENKV